MPPSQVLEQELAARLEGCTQTPKHGKNYAKHDPRRLAQLADRSTNSTPDEVFATHTYLYLETNHAHALLFLGRTQEAEQIYLQHRGEKMGSKTWEQAILQDFDDLEKAGLTSPEIARIRRCWCRRRRSASEL